MSDTDEPLTPECDERFGVLMHVIKEDQHNPAFLALLQEEAQMGYREARLVASLVEEILWLRDIYTGDQP